MDLNFTLNGEFDFIALYAAILSTIITVWEWRKWKNRNKIKLQISPNMKTFPIEDGKEYILLRVSNKGETMTTITHVVAYYWPSRKDKLLKRNKITMIINEPNIPKTMQVGDTFMFQAVQNKTIEERAKEGFLYFGVVHSMSDNEVIQRLKM